MTRFVVLFMLVGPRSAIAEPLRGVGTAVRQDTTTPVVDTSATTDVETVARLTDLRRAQARFERNRRARLPTTYSGISCQAVVGRYCFDFRDSNWEVRPDPPATAAERKDLIADLQLANARSPNAWIVGQLVRYLVDGGDTSGALTVARNCQSFPWWCLALEGYTLHLSKDYVSAELAFDRALLAMTPERRCTWTNLTEVLANDLRKMYDPLSCETRDSLQQTLWWLADPLYATPGNEVRTEHFSRHVINEMLHDARSPEGPWNRDDQQWLMRYGWPIGWERVLQTGSGARNSTLTGHFADGGRYYFPTRQALDHPTHQDRRTWEDEPRIPQSTYAIDGVEELVHSMRHDLTRFWRQDSVVLVVAFAVDDDEFDSDQPHKHAIVARATPTSPAKVSERDARSAQGTLTVTVAAVPQLLSLEIIPDSLDRVARRRWGEVLEPRPADQITLSDLMLVNATDGLPNTLDEALPLAITPWEIERGFPIGLYWEVYFPNRAATAMDVSLVVTRTGRSIFRRLAELTPLTSGKPPVSLAWQDVHDTAAPTHRRALEVTLPPNMATGDHALTLTVRIGQRQLETTKHIRVIEAKN